MLELLQKCFGEQMKTPEWQGKIQAMIPSWGRSLAKDASLCATTRSRSNAILQMSAH
jgi:malate dehydrogenase (quinone)